MISTSSEISRLMITADTVGGVWTYALDLAQTMSDRGIEVLLASSGPAPSSAQIRAVESLASTVSWHHRSAKLEWMDEPWDEIDATGEWLRGLATRFEPDLIHFNEYSHAGMEWEVPVLIGAHSCVLSWWRATKGHAAPSRYREYQRRVSLSLQRADLVVAPTSAMLCALQSEYGLLNRTAVIPNGRTLNCDLTGPKIEVIFSAGRVWDGAKNISLLNQIAGELDWPVQVAGATRKETNQAAGFSHLQLLGQLPEGELRQKLASSSIYASPALYEPFGLAVLEAALSRCALVLSDIPSFRELWEGAAIFVEASDAAGWTQALHALASDSEQRECWAARAEERGLQFTRERMGEAYAAAYARLLHLTVKAEPLDLTRKAA